MKCDRDYYKQQFGEALATAGFQPMFQGFEHSKNLVESMNLEYCQYESLRHTVEDLRQVFRRWVVQD